MGKRPYYKSGGFAGIFVVLLIGVLGSIGYFLKNYGFTLIPIAVGFYLYFKWDTKKSNEKKALSNKTCEDPAEQNIWWNSLDDQWKKIFNYHIARRTTLLPESYKENSELTPSEINHIIETRGSTERLNQVELSKVIQIKELNLYMMKLSDIKPLLQLKQLEVLDLGFNDKISNFEPISKLTNLKELHINFLFQNFSEVNALSGLTNLKKLYINNNDIKDISSLSQLKNLEVLDLSQNQISDLATIGQFKNLKRLHLNRNPLSIEKVKVLMKSLPNCDIEFT